MAGRFSALRHRDFRLYWVGFVVAVSGQQMQWMIEGWLIYQLSGSKLLLGLNGAAQFIPSTALTLFGGALADKFDQRRLLIAVQLLFIAVLGTLSALGVLGLLTAWHVIAGGFVLSAIGSFEGPARQAMFPHLVNREAMPSAVALNAMIHPATRVGAPVVGGLVSAFVFDFAGSASVAGGVVFAITAVAVAVYAAMLLKVHLPPVVRARGRSVLADMGAALGYIRRERAFVFLIGTAYYNMAFGVAMAVLFPVFAKDVLGVGPEGLGFMWGAMGVGSVAGVFIASSMAGPHQQRALLTGGACGNGRVHGGVRIVRVVLGVAGAAARGGDRRIHVERRGANEPADAGGKRVPGTGNGRLEHDAHERASDGRVAVRGRGGSGVRSVRGCGRRGCSARVRAGVQLAQQAVGASWRPARGRGVKGGLV